MKIECIVWLEHIVEKIEAKHGVQTFEVDEIFKNNPRVRRIERGKIKGENLYVATGQSDAGRYLAVFFICKKSKTVLIVTARDMDKKERKDYEESRKRR